MEERAKLVRGKITIKSKPGKGTTIKGVFPLKVAAS
jgi:signal transduction histidine kinase